MEIKVQKHVHISMVETYECTFDVDIPVGEDELEWLENEGYLDDADWGDAVFIDDNVTGQEFSIAD
jgi:hypothetical protein